MRHLRRLHKEEIIYGSIRVSSCFLISPSVVGVVLRGKTYDSRRLEEEQVGYLVPTVLVFSQHIALLVRISHQIWPNLLHHTYKTRASRPTIKPYSKRAVEWVGLLCLYKDIMDLSACLKCVEVARVNSGIDHTLGQELGTGGELTLSASGRQTAMLRSSASSRQVVIYLLL